MKYPITAEEFSTLHISAAGCEYELFAHFSKYTGDIYERGRAGKIREPDKVGEKVYAQMCGFADMVTQDEDLLEFMYAYARILADFSQDAAMQGIEDAQKGGQA